jgi:hypothetical protein
MTIPSEGGAVTATTPEVDLTSQEIWETTTGGTTYVNIRDPRVPNAWTKKKVGGKGTKRITITVEERLYNEELVAFERESQCPFRNGLLVRIHPKGAERGQFEVSDAEIIALLTQLNDDEFTNTLANTHSEVVVRRMLALAERHATVYRFRILEDEVANRFAVGKSSAFSAEIEADESRNRRVDI